ncbi:hypothetical protein [Merismopedia glauca]|uniref:Uncharacterized protein n=1 Tax=Merismopedia glauca CCAP 1448/3 TaxID=1296344 RepID=A0A2T1C8J1_9CYAN|nr:hypothetical protein [Merismopedia glauca]PSB04602.1 hypothetical protein C7B64_03365 [Merismopedia glauca CCAP 1448/3]
MESQELDLRSIKAAAKQQFAQIDGVEGIGIGDRTLNIYIHDSQVKQQLPSEFQGVPVNCVVTGDITSRA